MTKSVKGFAILACVVVVAFWQGVPSAGEVVPVRRRVAQPVVRATPRPVRTVEEAQKDSVILVEAFMVEARLSALYSLKVPAISEGDKSVTAEQIIKLLKDTNTASLKAGAKLAVAQGNSARTDSTSEVPIYSGSGNNRKMERVRLGTTFAAAVEIRWEKIFAELEFEHSSLEGSETQEKGTSLVRKRWTNNVYLEPGKPTLIGASQDEDTAWFLIVTASVKK